MRTIPDGLADKLDASASTWATCWRIARTDGVVLGFTTHDRDLRVDQDLYRATVSFQASAVVSGGTAAVDNLEASGVLQHQAIRQQDLAAGRYDAARVDVFLVDWTAPDAGRIILSSGFMGEVRTRDDQFTAEVRGLKQALQASFGAIASPECRAQLGDRRCRVNLHDIRHIGTVTSVIAPGRFSDPSLNEADGVYAYGLLRWHVGANAGLDGEVKTYTTGTIGLVTPPPFSIAAGDIYEVTAGCDKRFETCRDRFDNVENFRGEPFVPGLDAILDYPG